MDKMPDEFYMNHAYKEALKAYADGEVPVGAVVVINNQVIARGHNQVERLSDPTAHAEIIALTSAFNFLGSKYLPDATIYITVEPCLMCAGALYWSKVSRIVWGAGDEKNGHRRITEPNWPFHPRTEVTTGIMKAECAKLMTDFFRSKR